MKKNQLLGLLFLLTACSQDITVEVKRNPSIRFGYGTTTWQSNQYYFTDVAKIVAYPAGATQTGKIYNRLTLQAFGANSKGENLQMTLQFDVEDITQLIGTYRLSYSTTKGLAGVQVFNLNTGSLAAYDLVRSDSTALLQIQRQSQTDRLIAGVFQMTVQNTKDTTQRLRISNGTFLDITY